MSDEIFVYADLMGVSHFVGRLWVRNIRGKESASFEYDSSWLTRPERFALEPSLSLAQGTHHTESGRALFGAIGDSAPDRWGRALIQREERRKARAEKRALRSLQEIDYLLAVGDFTRQGALRFSRAQDGEFLSPQSKQSIPPLIKLGALLRAATHMASGEEDLRDLQLLLAPGSSLGGARAKASLLDARGKLLIAKFPQRDDAWPVIRWEAVALTLAAKAGITVPKWNLTTLQKKHILLLERFDRAGNTRIPFLSAMSMLGAVDNEEHSYLEIVDALRRYAAQPKQDAAQLWRRMVFNILIANTDDHLRNHAFLHHGDGWCLSPAYDLNPTPIDIKPRMLSLALDGADRTASLSLAYDVAAQFGVNNAQAKRIAEEVRVVVSGWRNCAKKFGLSAREIERMSSAFEPSSQR